jgi:hypothetical protein
MTLPPSVAPRPAVDLLADETALREWIAGYGEQYGSRRFPVASALAFKSYTWELIDAAVGRWASERRVVDVSATRVVLHCDPAGEPVLEFLDVRLAVLPDDPLAGRPGIKVVADDAELLQELKRTLVDGHLVLAVDAFGKLRGGGARPLWGTIAQSIGYPPATVEPALVPDRTEAVRQLLSILPVAAGGLVEFAEINEGEGWRPMLLRRTCCYAHTLPGCTPCLTCCLLDDAGRDTVADQDGVAWRRPGGCGPAIEPHPPASSVS